MNLILISKLIFSLSITPYEKKSLSACVFYQRTGVKDFMPYVCGCAKWLSVSSKKITKICPKDNNE